MLLATDGAMTWRSATVGKRQDVVASFGGWAVTPPGLYCSAAMPKGCRTGGPCYGRESCAMPSGTCTGSLERSRGVGDA